MPIRFEPDCDEVYDFQCQNNVECTDINNVCNGQSECSDGSDEKQELCSIYSIQSLPNTIYWKRNLGPKRKGNCETGEPLPNSKDSRESVYSQLMVS